MNKLPVINKPLIANNDFDEDEVFDDSSFLAKFDSTSFKDTRFSESNLNDSLNKTSGLNVSALCCDEEISGYDKLTGKTWIYPTNYPVRDYQFNIIKSAILKNTLVSLPTGLGKTFIAAVIMYNFYRWYPLGKIVFTAPTRPLVAQQIDACYNIIAIPPKDTIEMTGHMQVNTRKMHWQSKRVFFATPQVIYNDIKSGICPGDKMRCLVIDEAHKARGNYAYGQIVSTLTEMGHRTYRILALSATPGSKVEDVISVVKSLHIAHLELRTESCIDVAPYSHSRKINTVVIPLGPELTQLRQQYVEILDGYARRLKQFNILPQNLGNLSKGRIVMLYKEFQNKDRSARHPQHNYIMKDFTLLIALYHGLELLVKHGSRVFLNFFDEHPEKTWIQSDDRLTGLLERLRDDLGVNPLSLDRSILPDGTIPEMPKDLCFGHPKFYRLKEIILNHFTKANNAKQDTRAIVFCEYRESVNLVHCLLLQCRPLITAQMFVGQGASGKDGKTIVSQKQQLRVMRAFRAGACNVLVATCVAEEGLDVGSVDLILCFDISSRSPVRLVQRCGRTGRERGGQVHILVTEGREHQTLMDCMRQRDGLNNKIMQSKEVGNNLYSLNPRMVPQDFVPTCQKMFITVAKKPEAKDKDKDAEKPKKGQKDLRTMLAGRASTSTCGSTREISAELISEREFQVIFPEGFPSRIGAGDTKEFWAMSRESIKTLSKSEDTNHSQLSTWLEWQRTLQKTINIGHSKDTEILSSLLQYSDAKRFDMPVSTQNPTFNTQDLATQNFQFQLPSPVKPKPKQKKTKAVTTKSPVKSMKSPTKKDGDIRALFSTATKSTKSYTKLINDLGIPSDGSIPTRLINLLVDMNLDNTSADKTCYICQNVCDCTLLKSFRGNRTIPTFSLKFIVDPKLPDLDLMDDIDAESLIYCVKNNDSILSNDNQNIDISPVQDLKDELHNIKIEKTKPDNLDGSHNFDLEFKFSSPEQKSNKIEKTPEKIKENVNGHNNFELDFDFDSTNNVDITENKEKEPKIAKQDLDTNFAIGDIEDIFAESSPEETAHIEKVEEIKAVKVEKPKETLGFFGLDSIDDIFADYDDSIEKKPGETVQKSVSCTNKNTSVREETPKEKYIKAAEYPVSPSILSGRVKNVPTSPILCTQGRKFQLSTKKSKPSSSTPASNVRRQLIKSPLNGGKIDTKSTQRNSLHNSKDASMFTITQLVNMINKTDNESFLHRTSAVRPTNGKDSVKYDEERSVSPILLTQADRRKGTNTESSIDKKISTSQVSKSVSLIILDSDSDASNDTQLYDINEDEINELEKPENSGSHISSPINAKRKLESDADDFMTASPYFNKKQKLNDNNPKPLTLQEKVCAALASNKVDFKPSNNESFVNFSVSPRKLNSQKENEDPWHYNRETQYDDARDFDCRNNLEKLQIFKRDSYVKSPRNKFNSILYSNQSPKTQKRKLTFDDDCDDDFADDNPSPRQRPVNGGERKQRAKHKAPKVKHNSFLDTEVEVSGDSADSGDELSGDSAGSVAAFICDDEPAHRDIHAHYLQSVKSPVRGVFKILSQFVEEDNYEMDSFCVDSHIELTQANEMSELELAEIVLEEKRRRKKKTQLPTDPSDTSDSPIVRRKNKKARLIQSDSEDSS